MATEPSTILVATDGSTYAAAAVREATALARDLGDRLVVVTVWHELRGDFGLPLHAVFPELREAERAWATEIAEAAAQEARAAGVDAEAVVQRGKAGPAVCELARTLEPRLIVVGTHGWGHVGGLLFGSVSRAVMHDAPCPVLIVPAAAAAHDRGVAAAEPAFA